MAAAARTTGATSGPGARFPVLYDLVGFTGSGLAHLNWKPFSDNLAERAARLIHDGRMGPAIIVLPGLLHEPRRQPVRELFRASVATPTTCVDEIVPFVDREFRTLASREHRGCFGKSSGGYGAMIHGMRYARALGRDREPQRRRLLRLRLPLRLAEHAQRAGEAPPAGAQGRARRAAARHRRRAQPARGTRRRPRAPLPRVGLEEAQGEQRRGARDHEPLHGGHLRPRPAGAARLPAALPPRDGRAHRAALAALARARPGAAGRAALRADLRRLKGIYIDCGWRDQYRIHYGCAAAVSPPRRGGHPAPLRGIRRRPLRRRLPHGREPALPVPGAAPVTRP